MKMRKNLQDIYKILTQDEIILRLLYYKPINANDNPLDLNKENILDKPIEEKWEIIMDRIKTTPTTDKLDIEPKCRVCFYPSRRGNTNNYLYATQQVTFDVLVHFDYDNVDLRLSWICDRINELLFDKRITGIGKINFVSGSSIPQPIEKYIGYRLIYDFGSGQ
jgi:hypothetical protein